MNDTKVRTGTLVRAGKPPETAPAGRLCEQCDRVLSIYNLEALCGPCEKAASA